MQLRHTQNSQLEQLISKDNYQLRGHFDNEQIYLQLVHATQTDQPILSAIQKSISCSKGARIFQLTIPIKSKPESLAYLFDKNEQLFQYMKQGQNIKVQVENSNGIVTILGKHPTKKKECVQLHKFVLQQKIAAQQKQGKISHQNKLKQEAKKQLKLLSQACKNKQFDILRESNLRYVLSQLSDKLLLLYENSNQKIGYNAQVQRVISKIQCLGREIQGMQMKTADLFQLNNNLNDLVVQRQQQINEMREQGIQKHKQIKYIINQINSQNEQKFNRLYDNLAEQQQIIKQFKQKLRPELMQKMQQISSEIRGKQRNQKLQIIQKIQASKLEQIVRTAIDKTAKFYKHFAFKGNNITKQDDFIFPTILIGSRPLREQNQFCIRIAKMGILKKIYPGVCVGIIDSKHKNKQSCDSGDNVIEYGCAGKLFQANKYINTQGSGYSAGDYVKVKVDFQSSSISWFVNQKLNCKYGNKNIGNLSIDWRPYIFMRDKGDSVDWIIKQ